MFVNLKGKKIFLKILICNLNQMQKNSKNEKYINFLSSPAAPSFLFFCSRHRIAPENGVVILLIGLLNDTLTFQDHRVSVACE